MRFEDTFVIDGEPLRRLLRFSFCLRLLLLPASVLFSWQKDPQRLLGQVHHMAQRGLDGIIPPQILIDRFRLGRRFDDYQ